MAPCKIDGNLETVGGSQETRAICWVRCLRNLRFQETVDQFTYLEIVKFVLFYV